MSERPSHDQEPQAAADSLPWRLLRWLKREFISLLPAIIYFFAAFTVLSVNEDVVLGHLEIGITHLLRPFLSALLVAKILLVANHMPFINAFSGRPLIWATAWKAAIYWSFGLLFQLAESFLGHLADGQVTSSGLVLAVEDALTYRFALVQTWLALLLTMFVALQQLIEATGSQKVRELFFGVPAH